MKDSPITSRFGDEEHQKLIKHTLNAVEQGW